jgi:hypothetical protein
MEIKTGEEHEQKFSQFSEEIRDGRVFSEKPKDVWSQNDSAEQQTHYSWKPGTARERRNSNNDRHSQGEFRQ